MVDKNSILTGNSDSLRSLIKAELVASQEKILSLIANHHPTVTTGTFDVKSVTDPTLVQPLSRLTTDTISKRQQEVRTVIESYEQRLGDNHDLGITLGQFPEAPPLRLTAVTFFPSGAVSFIGLDARGKSANMYDTLDHFSVILKKLRRLNGRGAKSPVSFYSVST